MDNMKNIKKQWLNSLVFLDNCVIHCIIVVILFLYSSTIFENINVFVGNLYKFSIVKIVVLLLIVYVSPKDTLIAILLAISYLVSLNYSVHANNEYFRSRRNKKNKSSSTESRQMSSRTESRPMSSRTESRPMSSRTQSNSMSSRTESRPMSSRTESRPMSSRTESTPMSSRSESTPMSSRSESTPMSSRSESTPMSSRGRNIKENFEGFPFQRKNENSDFLDSHKSTDCMDNYIPLNESVSNVCEPVSTFEHSLNTQGLNNPEGFGRISKGHPLN
jgi:hypothetical protein